VRSALVDNAARPAMQGIGLAIAADALLRFVI
jgi:hypothetical protein